MRTRPFFLPLGRAGLAIGTLLGLLVTAGAGADSHTGNSPSNPVPLTAAFWSVSVYGHQEGGTVCWLFGEDGSLRVEMRRALGGNPAAAAQDLPDLEPLFHQMGEGWTVILGPGESGTLNRWGREWRNVPPGLARVVRLVASSVGAFPDTPPHLPFALDVGGSPRRQGIARPRVLPGSAAVPNRTIARRFQLSPLDLEGDGLEPAPGFRRKMIARGRGAGGAGEIVILTWLPTVDGEGSVLRVHSSRRPGTLVLDYSLTSMPNPPEPEVFLPLWPLSQFYGSP